MLPCKLRCPPNRSVTAKRIQARAVADTEVLHRQGLGRPIGQRRTVRLPDSFTLRHLLPPRSRKTRSRSDCPDGLLGPNPGQWLRGTIPQSEGMGIQTKMNPMGPIAWAIDQRI